MRKLTHVILDLDNTIINSLEPTEKQAKNLVSYILKDENDEVEYIIYERPHLQEFLDYLFENFKVAVWTAATKDYALFIIDNIILQNRPERHLEFFLFRYHSDISEELTDGVCPKDLNMVWDNFKDFTKENTIIIDDLEDVYMPQMYNSYPIPPFIANKKGAKNDVELLKLMRKMDDESPNHLEPNEGHHPNAHLLTKETLQKALLKAEKSVEEETDDTDDDRGENDERENYRGENDGDEDD